MDMRTTWMRHFFTAEFFRFLIVGGSAAVIHWLSRYLLSMYFQFSTAVVMAYGVGIATAFVLNRVFVFPLSSKPLKVQAAYFVAVNLAFFPVVWVASMVLSEWILPALGVYRYHEGIAHGIAILLPVFGAFLLHKFKTFAN